MMALTTIAVVWLLGQAPTARQGMAAAAHPLAVEAALDILRQGGNAIDAGIAANAVLTVVEPMSCGVGGDLFAIVWEAKSSKLYGLNASGRSPYGLSRDFFVKRGLRQVPLKGPLSWSVPGCVSGWEQLRGRFGSMPLERLLQPAIKAGEEGFLVTPVIGRGWRASQRLLASTADGAKTFLRADGRAPRPGETMHNPRLAATYRVLGREGEASFYRGSLAKKFVAASQAHGGFISAKDLADHTATWVAPISTTYRGYTVWELPPNGQGLAVLQLLNLLEGFEINKFGHNSAEFLHLFVEAKKLAYADRAAFYADPDFAKRLPIAQLASKSYADRQRQRIDREHAALTVPAGDPRLTQSDTTYLTVVDKDRNAISLIQSNYYGWGSGLPAGDLGFMIQNRGNLFSLDPKHPNVFEPHKRPFHTIIPAFVTQAGKPLLCFGVMGGDMQPQGQVQVLVNMLDFGMEPWQAGRMPRCRHDGSSTPIGDVMTDGGRVVLEPDIPEAVAVELRKKGHQVSRGQPTASFGGYQCIMIDHQHGLLRGGTEPRNDGVVRGY